MIIILHAYGLGHSHGPHMAKSFVVNAKYIQKVINNLGFLVFIIFEDLSLLFSNLKVCQKQVRSLCVGLNLEEVVNILDIVDLN